MVPNVVKSREGWELYIVTDGILLGEGWELYIVTDGVMVGILLGEGVHWAASHSNIPSVTIYSSFTQ
jgi:hypothetical protein